MHALLLTPWGMMWGLALALYAAGKWASYAAAMAGMRGDVSASRKAAFLLLFPGMDAGAFLAGRRARGGSQAEGIHELVNVILGAGLLWLGARQVAPGHPLMRGWIGMIGLVMLLHFGVLQLVLRAWRRVGYDAPPLMDHPLRACSVGEFWNVRWNTAFRQLAHGFIFRPLVRRIGVGPAMLITFLVSGLVHDLVISAPAGGGYGLPTLYFLLQGAGLYFERSAAGRRWLRRPMAKRIYAMAVVIAPVGLLFHPMFVRRVMLPFMVAIGALR